VTVDGAALQDAQAGIKEAKGIFVEMYPLWKNRNELIKIKIRIFNGNVKSILLYGCETWEVTTKVNK